MTSAALALALAVSLACPPSRVPTEKTFRFGMTVECDLDGNGVVDRIRVHGVRPNAYSYDDFEVMVAGDRMTAQGLSLDSTFAIVDIDSSDAWLEIAVTEQGPSDDYATHFFAFDGDSILFMGTLPGTSELSIDGSGIVRSQTRGQILHTWFHPAYFRLDASHRLVAIELPLYTMNAPVRMRRALALRRSPTDSRIVLRLKPGDHAVILGSDDRRWCLVRGPSGASGWFAVDELSGSTEEVFKGLSSAD